MMTSVFAGNWEYAEPGDELGGYATKAEEGDYFSIQLDFTVPFIKTYSVLHYNEQGVIREYAPVPVFYEIEPNLAFNIVTFNHGAEYFIRFMTTRTEGEVTHLDTLATPLKNPFNPKENDLSKIIELVKTLYSEKDTNSQIKTVWRCKKAA